MPRRQDSATCSYCREQIPLSARRCPSCGERLPAQDDDPPPRRLRQPVDDDPPPRRLRRRPSDEDFEEARPRRRPPPDDYDEPPRRRRRPPPSDDYDDEDYDDDYDDRPRRRRRGEYATCPHCRCPGHADKASFTWWGGLIGPALLSHVTCRRCGRGYNGKTGKDNTIGIVIYTGVGIVLGIVVFVLILMGNSR